MSPMILPTLKARVQAMLNKAGYRIERVRPTSNDPYADQASLLAACGIVPNAIVDAGAHIGTTVERYRSLFPASTIHAFEPFPSSFARLREHTASDTRVRAIEGALSDRIGAARLNTFTHEQANSLLAIGASAARYFDASLLVGQGAIEVRTTTLDQYCLDASLEAVDILKMDIQGAELPALRGARRLLSEGSISLIYVEAEFAEVYAGQGTFLDLCVYLRDLGYEMFNFYDLCRGRNGRLVAADVIYLRRDLTDRLSR